MFHQSHTPFLKWAGGKRWLALYLAPVLREILNETKGSYYEPFLGAGSMYFGLAPQRSVLSDLNEELIETYIQVRDSWKAVEEVMKGWNVSKENYYKIRASRPRSGVQKAARFIWLNRTCYGGLYRVNKNNEFNVPYGGGRTPDILYQSNMLRQCSDVLKGKPFNDRSVDLVVADFEKVMMKAKAGDVIYCDPTYSCVSSATFDRYGTIIFDWSGQKRLAYSAKDASERGALVLVSNAFSEDLHHLFGADYKIILSRKKTIGNYASSDRKHMEYLFVMDPMKRSHLWFSLASKLQTKDQVSKKITERIGMVGIL